MTDRSQKHSTGLIAENFIGAHYVTRVKREKEAGDQSLFFTLDPKSAYRHIRNYLAGQFVGATRDEELLHEVLKTLFCKLYIKRQGTIKAQQGSRSGAEIASEYRKVFSKVRQLLPTTFGESEELLLDTESISYVDSLLDKVAIDDPSSDPIGDAYEAFIGSSARGQEGQFFTPQNAVKLLVSIVNPRPGEKVIDPACGAGGFLSAAARHLMNSGATAREVAASVFGIDKDRYLVGLASAHLSIVTLDQPQVYCADSLKWAPEDGQSFPLKDHLGTFDVVLANPPFGSRIVAASPDIQRTYELGYRWKVNAKAGRLVKTETIQNNVPPQVLFVERCLSLVKPGGRLGIVVPESLISSKNHRYVVQYIRDHAQVRAVIGMPDALFKTSGKGGTHTKTCLLFLEKKNPDTAGKRRRKIFIAEAKWCGRDSRGNKIQYDDLPKIAARFGVSNNGDFKGQNHLAYEISEDQIVDDVLAPRYYNPEVASEMSLLHSTHDSIKVGDLIASGQIELATGDEVGKLAYGTGPVPFVRTSDISTWEIKVDPKHGLSEEVYQKYARKQDVQEGDILMVRDGTYLIGTCAYITKYDTKIVYQSHIYKLRIRDHSQLSPYLLLAALSSVPVQQQIKAKRFTQDIIDSLGNRIHELVLPIPKDKAVRDRVTKMVERAIQDRVEARELARRACLELIGTAGAATNGNELAQLVPVSSPVGV
jgi:type I restriction enzyme M protein